MALLSWGDQIERLGERMPADRGLHRSLRRPSTAMRYRTTSSSARSRFSTVSRSSGRRSGRSDPPRGAGRDLSSCGYVNVPPARFCAACGKAFGEAIAVPDGEERRQQITVLFCDLVGFTELSQSLDPEDLRDLLAEYHRICGEVVGHHDGHVAQFLGDGVVVYFGFPRAHEDDARRAVRCGLDILSEIQAYAAGSASPSEALLQVRAGIHTGRVVVGSVGPQGAYLAQGGTPNIAARLQSEAAPGTLAVSDATWRIVQGYFRGESLGERELKGVAQPMRLWRVTGASGAGPAWR